MSYEDPVQIFLSSMREKQAKSEEEVGVRGRVSSRSSSASKPAIRSKSSARSTPRVIHATPRAHEDHNLPRPPLPPREQMSFPQFSPERAYQSVRDRKPMHDVDQNINNAATWPSTRLRTQSSGRMLQYGTPRTTSVTEREANVKLYHLFQKNSPEFELDNGKVQLTWSPAVNEQTYCGETHYIPNSAPESGPISVCSAFFYSTYYLEAAWLKRKERISPTVYTSSLAKAASDFNRSHKCSMTHSTPPASSANTTSIFRKLSKKLFDSRSKGEKDREDVSSKAAEPVPWNKSFFEED